MTKGVMGFVKGAGMGLLLGCIAGAMGSRYMHANKKGLKKMWQGAAQCWRPDGQHHQHVLTDPAGNGGNFVNTLY